MTDVRLTATNPDDSSVVPVACNEKGELKLEEVPTFDGNVDGDLTVSGSAEVKSPSGASFRCNGDGIYYYNTSGDSTGFILANGNAKFADKLEGGSTNSAYGALLYTNSPQPNEACLYARNYNNSGTGNIIVCEGPIGGYVFTVKTDGSVTFAGNKAGFTAQGHLWCTTERGDTVKLAATVGGAGLWEDYTPPSRVSDLKDRWSEKDVIRPVPEESSQDEPETPQ